MKKAAVVIDAWKLPIFERHLQKGQFSFENKGPMTPGTLVLQVPFTPEQHQALYHVLRSAYNEASLTRPPKAE